MTWNNIYSFLVLESQSSMLQDLATYLWSLSVGFLPVLCRFHPIKPVPCCSLACHCTVLDLCLCHYTVFCSVSIWFCKWIPFPVSHKDTDKSLDLVPISIQCNFISFYTCRDPVSNRFSFTSFIGTVGNPIANLKKYKTVPRVCALQNI